MFVLIEKLALLLLMFFYPDILYDADLRWEVNTVVNNLEVLPRLDNLVQNWRAMSAYLLFGAGHSQHVPLLNSINARWKPHGKIG